VYVLADVGFHEHEYVDEYGRYESDKWHPGVDGRFYAARRYEPSTGRRIRRRKTFGHFQLFGVRGGVEIIGRYHRHNGYGHAEVAQCSTNLKPAGTFLANVRYYFYKRVPSPPPPPERRTNSPVRYSVARAAIRPRLSGWVERGEG